jgi:hypothetical protein
VFIGHRRQPGGVVDLHLTRHQKGADFHVRRRLRLAHFRNHRLAFYAFDLIELNGDDLRDLLKAAAQEFWSQRDDLRAVNVGVTFKGRVPRRRDYRAFI